MLSVTFVIVIVVFGVGIIQTNAECVESESVIDLVFAVDGSGSICNKDPSRWNYGSGCDNWEQIINFITEFVTVMEPSETGTHVGLVSFSTEGRLLAGLSWYYSADSMNEYIKGNLTYPDGATNTTGGLEMTKDKVIGQAGDRETVRNVVVVITDGFPTHPIPNPRERALDMANLLKEKADVFAVGVTSDIDDSFLSDISSGGVKDVNWFHISNFEGLKEIIDPVVQQVCITTTPLASPTPTPTSLTTKCVESESVVDLVFAVDGSGSICDPDPSRWKYSSGCDNWEQIINFITEFVTVMEPSETGTHVGLVSFSTEGRLLAGLSWYYSADSMNEYIKGNLTYPGGDTNTTGGLEMTKDKVIGQAGDRETVRNVVVVITDGFPTLPKPNPRERALDMANLLKEKADVFAVGVTSDIDDSFLSDISSGGVKDVNWFQIDSFEGLKEIVDPVVQQACITTTRPTTPTATPTYPNTCNKKLILVAIAAALAGIMIGLIVASLMNCCGRKTPKSQDSKPETGEPYLSPMPRPVNETDSGRYEDLSTEGYADITSVSYMTPRK